MASYSRNARKLLITWALVCLCLSMLCENSMTTIMWRRKFLVQHVLQLQNDAAKHARRAALDEFLGWEDEIIEAQLETQAQRLWNKTDMEYDHMIQKEQEAHDYWTLAYQEQQESLALSQEAAEDGYKFNMYYQLAKEEAYEASHFKDDYCDKYYIPAFWCRCVGQLAGWDSVQAQQSMQATNDMQVALIEEQAANHAALLSRWFHTNATRHAQLANASAMLAQQWNESYQRDYAIAQQLDTITKELWMESRGELGNATQYALDAQQEWQQAITLAHFVVTYQDEAVLYSIMAIVLASILFFLTFHYLVSNSCRNVVAAWLVGFQGIEPGLLHAVIYALGHVCIFVLVLGGTTRDRNGSILLLLLEQSTATLHDSRGAIVLIFAMQAALVQCMYLYIPSCLYHRMCQEDHNSDGATFTATIWKARLIHFMGAFVKHWVTPAALFCIEMLILVNLRCVSLFAVSDTTWWLLFVLLLVIAAVHFLFQLPLPPGGGSSRLDDSSMDVVSTQPVASEYTPLVQSKENHTIKRNEEEECAKSNESRSLVDVELASTASIPDTCSHSIWSCCGCSPHCPTNEVLQEEIMSVREHAALLALPLTLLILVRAYNLIFYHCLPTLYRLHPGFPTWLVPIVMMIVTSWLAVQSLICCHDDGAVGELAKEKSIH